jgi:hypothetical protein
MGKSKNINIRLDEVRDAKIVSFLEEKNATTFIIKEALKLYMDLYNNMGQGQQLEEKQVPNKIGKFKNMGR